MAESEEIVNFRDFLEKCPKVASLDPTPEINDFGGVGGGTQEFPKMIPAGIRIFVNS
jgi:hypothetical protein